MALWEGLLKFRSRSGPERNFRGESGGATGGMLQKEKAEEGAPAFFRCILFVHLARSTFSIAISIFSITYDWPVSGLGAGKMPHLHGHASKKL